MTTSQSLVLYIMMFLNPIHYVCDCPEETIFAPDIDNVCKNSNFKMSCLMTYTYPFGEVTLGIDIYDSGCWAYPYYEVCLLCLNGASTFHVLFMWHKRAILSS